MSKVKDKSLQEFYYYGFNKFNIITNNKSIEEYYETYKNQDDGLSDNSKFIIESRYLMDRLDENNNIIKESTWYEISRRVSRMLSCGETLYTKDINRIRMLELNIFSDLYNRRFIFNSPALFNLGIDLTVNPDFSHLIYNNVIEYNDYVKLFENRSQYQMCFACFVIPVEDSLSGIYDSVKNAALISMKGGGVGTNFGRTREKGSLIRKGQGGISSGPLSWIKQWETMAEEVVQGGRRRAALMGLMDINHPDIEEFISCKDDDNVLSFFNISVSLTDKFMDAVLSENIDEQFELLSRVDPKNNKFINAKELWYKICEHAWKRGDPGIHFVDLSNQDSILKMNSNWSIEATNPCGEMNLPYYVGPDHKNKYSEINPHCTQKEYNTKNIIEWNNNNNYDGNFADSGSACNLGSINLTGFVDKENKIFNFEELARQIKRSCYYLDLMIDVSKYPLQGIERNSIMIRPIGLGMMGLHDTAIMLNMPYKYESAFSDFANDIGKYYGIESLIASTEMVTKLGKERFPESDCVKDLFDEWIDYVKKDIEYHDSSIDINKIDIYEKIYDYLLIAQNNNLKFIPPSIRNTLIECYSYNREYFKNIIDNLCNSNIRNSRRLSIAPSGTISLVADVSSGLEPNFAYMWNRRVTVKGENGETEYKTVPYVHKLLPEEYKKELEETGTINNEIFKTALEISPNDHLEIMGILNKYIDTSISKCVAKGTKIQTSNGIISIEDFSENRNIDTFVDISNKNIYVKDMNGNWQKVLSHYYGGKKKTIKIKMDNGFILECSENHKLMTENGWKKASNITVNDRIEMLDCDYDDINHKTNLPLKYYYMKIKEIKYSENDIFDIEVENTHSYLISGIVSHNTINMPNDATIEDIHNIYTRAHELGIKGITIYRDGSRSYQPLQSTSKKEEENNNEKSNNIQDITEEQISNILEEYNEDKLINLIKNNDLLLNKILSALFNSKIPLEISNDKEVKNPTNGTGSFIQIKSPYGTIHVAAKFNSRDQMREIFITMNKSGQELKAITEALSRLISIALQECINYKDTYNRLIKTLKGISGFEAFIYDNIRTGEEHLVKSIPDVIAYVLPDLEYLYLINKYGNNKRTLKRMTAEVKLFNDTIINNNEDNETENNNKEEDISSENYLKKHNKFKELICPECGGTSFYKSDGCDKCLTCGYSKCGV